MSTGLLHSHKLFVLLFLLHYVVKLILLLLNRDEQLAKYSKLTKVAEIILSVGFLVTGIWMAINANTFSTLFIVKLICVFASIPLAVIGFKKKNKVIAFISVFLIIMAYGLAEMSRKAKTGPKINTSSIQVPIEVGKFVYTNSCVSCHGADGKLGVSGAKNLSLTSLNAAEQKALIMDGKNAMPGYKNAITEAEIDAVILYISTFKQ